MVTITQMHTDQNRCTQIKADTHRSEPMHTDDGYLCASALICVHRCSKSSKGQASLEMTVALLGVMLLLIGSLKLFLWINDGLVERQRSYEATRQAAGNAPPGQQAAQWTEPQKLNLFK